MRFRVLHNHYHSSLSPIAVWLLSTRNRMGLVTACDNRWQPHPSCQYWSTAYLLTLPLPSAQQASAPEGGAHDLVRLAAYGGAGSSAFGAPCWVSNGQQAAPPTQHFVPTPGPIGTLCHLSSHRLRPMTIQLSICHGVCVAMPFTHTEAHSFCLYISLCTCTAHTQRSRNPSSGCSPLPNFVPCVDSKPKDSDWCA
jgi:hypothetical protein